MKSSLEQLKSRGYVVDEELGKYKFVDNDETIRMLKSKSPTTRTSAAKIIGIRKASSLLPLLCNSLKAERKLYSKIAICEAIEGYGVPALKYLLPLIGKIGKNQHKKIGLVDLKKKSYPLPRDIATRIIIRIGEEALPILENILESGNYEQKVEIVDAIGHIAFNFKDQRSEKVLLNAYKNSNDQLLRWKILRAFRSFNGGEVVKILEKEKSCDNFIFREEAKRSLAQIEKNLMRTE
jgi:HEAT repeat protein